jgi:hypothetical protein
MAPSRFAVVEEPAELPYHPVSAIRLSDDEPADVNLNQI